MILMAEFGRLAGLSAADRHLPPILMEPVSAGAAAEGRVSGSTKCHGRPWPARPSVKTGGVARVRPSVKASGWCRMLRMTKTVNLPGGTALPLIGFGTWQLRSD